MFDRRHNPHPSLGAPRPHRWRAILTFCVLGAVGCVSGCQLPWTVETVRQLTAPSVIDDLRVVDPAAQPAERYQRDRFGQRWSDDVEVEFGHNGCDTRNDILRRDLNNLQVKPGTHDCVAYSGDFIDPYTGQAVHFQRGADGNAADVHIDHVVALANAWATGASEWDDDTRRNFANDPQNLVATLKDANKAKGAHDAAGWLPPNENYRCEFARTQITVKRAYGLGVTPAEKQALLDALGTCPQP